MSDLAAPPRAQAPMPQRLAWILAYMIHDSSIQGMPDQAIEGGQRALALVPENGVATLRGALELRRFGLPGPASVFFRGWLVSSLARLGRFDEAAVQAEEGLRIARAADQPLVLMVGAHYVAGFHLAHRPDLPLAIVELERSIELCHTWKLPAWYSSIASILGYAYAHSGRMEDGESLMRQSIEVSHAGGAW